MPLPQLAEQLDAAQLELDEAGRPPAPLLVVDADAPATTEQMRRAVARLADARAVVVVVAQESLPAQPILDAADVCLITPMSGAPRQAVAVPDPVAELSRLHDAV